MRNYLARLGWSHGDDEFFTTEQAIEWFGLEQVGKSAARFDFAKLENLNGQHIRATGDTELVAAVEDMIARQGGPALTAEREAMLRHAMPGLKSRAKTVVELIDLAHYILADRPFLPEEKAAKNLAGDAPALLARLTERLQLASEWTTGSLEQTVRDFAEEEDLKLGRIAQPLRVALTGRAVSPGVFDVMETIGREETLARLRDVARER
jgi:glutamyl-tRNA synthetase